MGFREKSHLSLLLEGRFGAGPSHDIVRNPHPVESKGIANVQECANSRLDGRTGGSSGSGGAEPHPDRDEPQFTGVGLQKPGGDPIPHLGVLTISPGGAVSGVAQPRRRVWPSGGRPHSDSNKGKAAGPRTVDLEGE
jgi:hypothetical protein